MKAVEDGYLQSRIAHRAKQRKDQTDSGERVVVGVNRYRRPEPESPIGETFRLDPGAASAVVDRYKRTLDSRDNAKVESSLARLSEAARDDGINVMPFIVDCCHALATVGEVSKCLKQEWGAFQEPIRF